jgi:hypothetical protein
MKRIFLILLAAVLLVPLSACATAQYADDVKLDALTSSVESALPTRTDYTTAEAGSLDDYFLMPDYVTESVVRFSMNAKNLDEYGIFHVTDGNAAAMEKLLRGYLERSYEDNHVWYDSYMPEETPKLRDAEVRVFGNYVVYAIYSDADKATLFNAVKATLNK